MLLLSWSWSGVGEGGTATRVGRRNDRVGDDDLGSKDNVPIGAREALSVGELGEESRLDFILVYCVEGSFFMYLTSVES